MRYSALLLPALLLLALSSITEYRLRIGLSASVPELATYLALGAALVHPRTAPASAAARRLGLLLLLLVLGLTVRAFWLKLLRADDEQSPFSRIRDVSVPLLLPLVFYQRIRLERRALVRIGWALVLGGALAGLLGVLQFFTGRFYLFEGIEFTAYKTKLARTYTLARWFDLDVKHLARGLYGFPIAYAASLIVPAVLAFALAWQGPWRRRALALGAWLLMYAGLYLSFSRSVVLVLPFGCYLGARAARGRLIGATPLLMALGYAFVAFFGTRLDLPLFGDDDVGTLDDRGYTVLALGDLMARDPAILGVGSTLRGWKQWYELAPHNWIASALLGDGLPITLVRLTLYGALFALLFPRRRGRDPEVQALRAGLWSGSYTLLAIVGETEPFAGISEYLLAGIALTGLAVTASPAGEEAAADSEAEAAAGGR